MKPIRLEMNGFGSFMGTKTEGVVIDFTKLDNVFLIKGNTAGGNSGNSEYSNGAGKSTIFEAICYALYGKTPKMEKMSGNESEKKKSLKSSQLKLLGDCGIEPKVIYTFKLGDKTYTVQRGLPENDENTFMREGENNDKIIGESDGSTGLKGKKAIDGYLKKIFPVTYEQFISIIMLPQGNLSKFFSGKSSDRKDILRAIFHTEIYEQMEKVLNQANEIMKNKCTEKREQIYKEINEVKISQIENQDECEFIKEKTKLCDIYNKPKRNIFKKRNSSDFDNIVENLKKLNDSDEDNLKKCISEIDKKELELDILNTKINKLKNAKEFKEEIDEALQNVADVQSYVNSKDAQNVIDELNKARNENSQYKEDFENLNQSKISKKDLEKQKEEAEKVYNEEDKRQSEKRKIHDITKELKVGDKCPVCGGVINDLNHVGEEINEEEKEYLENLKVNFESLSKKLDDCNKEIVAQERDLKHLRDSIIKHIKQIYDETQNNTDEKKIISLVNQLTDIDKICKTNDDKSFYEKIDEIIDKIIEDLQKFIDRIIIEDVESYKDKDLKELKKKISERKGSTDKLKEQLNEILSKYDISETIEKEEIEQIINDTEENYKKKKNELRELREKRTDYYNAVSAEHNNIIRCKTIKEYLDKLREYEENHIWIEKLSNMKRKDNSKNTKGVGLEDYVLSGYMDKIIEKANEQLKTLSKGEMQFKKKEGDASITLDFDVITKTAVDVSSVSGGESFQASLAITLALGEVVQEIDSSSGKEIIQLDSLFIDEGFGSLDKANIQNVIDTITSLEESDTSRIIGLISHIEELDKAFERGGIVVKKDGDGCSTIEYD